MWEQINELGAKKKKEKEGREVDVRGSTEQSSRAERGEEGLEVEKPGGQTGSQSAGEKKRKRVRQKANTDRDRRRKADRHADSHADA